MAPPSMLLGADTSPKHLASTLKGAGANNDRDFYLSAMRIFDFNFDEGCVRRSTTYMTSSDDRV